MTNFFYGIAVACLVNTFLLFHIYEKPKPKTMIIEYRAEETAALDDIGMIRLTQADIEKIIEND